MARRKSPSDFRTMRRLLPDDAFALVTGERMDPSDIVSEEVWGGIVHLPDHVALETSNYHGSELAMAESLWGDWLKVLGRSHDELFEGMLDASDCFQASTFDALHGYYRSAVSNLRCALELVAIGCLGNLDPADGDYRRWKKSNIGSLRYSTCLKRIRRATNRTIPPKILDPKGWADSLYDELCAYAHSRPDASDGEMRSSNGPIYVAEAVEKVFSLQVTTYAGCYVFAKIGRPKLRLPQSSKFLFKATFPRSREDIADSFNSIPPG